MVHLVYCDDKEQELSKIIEGQKTMVVRGAAGRKIPHSRVFEGEELFFMQKGTKTITASAVVTHVENYVKLSDAEIDAVLENAQEKLMLSDRQKKRWHKKCLCLIAFNEVKTIEPLAFERQSNMDDWLILDNIEDVLVGSSITFDYEKSKLK